jgi:choline-sulfatase
MTLKPYLWALLVVCFSNHVIVADDRPNILFIAIDDMNDWVGCFAGHSQVKTPHIDALARRGVRFTNAHCQAPICNPSRVSMLLGKFPSTTGMYFMGPSFRTVEPTKSDETLFQTFRKSGYYSATKGKVFHGVADPDSFDHIETTTGWRQDRKQRIVTLPGSQLWDWGQVDVPDEEQSDFQTAAWAANELPALAAKDQPFLLAIGFQLPHVPIYTSKKWIDMYPLDAVDLPATIPRDGDDLPEIAKQLSLNPNAPRHDWMVENQQWRPAVQAYLAANSFVDHLVGMVMGGLERCGEADNTIIVLWSDHGFHLGEKQRWAKRSLWEESTRVPLIFVGPGVAVNARCSRPVGLIDVFPTLLDVCGLPPREDLEGQSLQALLRDVTAPKDRPALCTFGPNNHGVISERYRYIRYADGSDEFYDMESDAHQWKNLAHGVNRTTDVEALITEHATWLPKVNARVLPGSTGSDSPLYGEGEAKRSLNSR